MSHDTRAMTSIAHERQHGWRQEAAADRRSQAQTLETGPAASGRRSITIGFGQFALAGLRRRITGASA